MIQGDRHWRAPLIAEHLEVGERTVYRDLDRLRDGGVPVLFDADTGGYRIQPGFFLPALDLTPEEACALLLLAERVGGTEQLPLTRPAANAMEKLKVGLPHALRDAVGEMLPNVHFHLAAGEQEGNEGAWSTVSHAIAQCLPLRCVYEPAHGDPQQDSPEQFRLDPYHLYWGQRAWYVIGLHHGRSEPRTLRLSRFTRIEPIDGFFEKPKEFSLDDYLGHAWRMIPGDRVRRRIALRFTPKVAETVADTYWHRSQQIDYHEDGSITASFEIDGLDEIAWWVLSYGPHCEVLEPSELRQQVAMLLREAAEFYE